MVMEQRDQAGFGLLWKDEGVQGFSKNLDISMKKFRSFLSELPLSVIYIYCIPFSFKKFLLIKNKKGSNHETWSNK